MNPFSNNIIFLDTEFSSLNPYIGEMLSIGLVKTEGEELSLELEYSGPFSDWVKKNILPTLNEPKVSREDAIRKIKEFVGDTNPYTVAQVNEFDEIYLYKLFGTGNEPFHWIPIDFASMLFALGIDPEGYGRGEQDELFNGLGVDYSKYTEHHALDDAKLLRDIYLKLLDR